MGNNTMPKCACRMCNQLGINKFPVRRRGGNNAYLCEWHTRHMDPYSAENPVYIGDTKASGETFSYELETMCPTLMTRIELCIAGFRPTSDCTVDVEFKSPIYNGFNGVSAYFPSIQDLLESGDMRIDSNCGTHFHCGQKDYITPVYMAYIRRFYHSLFLPLFAEIAKDSEKVERIFGRPVSGWAGLASRNTSAVKHELFVNTQHEYTLEFRNAKFVTAAQYVECAKLCREIMRKIVATFCPVVESLGLASRPFDQKKLFDDNGNGYNAGIYQLSEEERITLKKAADKTARQIVKVWEKA